MYVLSKQLVDNGYFHYVMHIINGDFYIKQN